MTGTPEGVNAVAAGDTRGTIAGLGEIEVTVVG
jgi:2-keto-4-pentenoate hydratase/2-oxohepta-3-ene-1,7-dioic acid hydratase in catechol pathway